MAFKELADLDCSVTTAIGGRDKKSNKPNPTNIEGYFIGTRQVPSKKSKTGLAALHILQTKKGNVGVWGKTNLDQKMLAVNPGQLCRISFSGMVETKNNPMYKYRVEVDADNTIEVNVPALEPGQEPENLNADDDVNSPDSFDAGSDDYSDDADPSADQMPPDEVQTTKSKPPAQPARAATPAQQERVQRMLGARKQAS